MSEEELYFDKKNLLQIFSEITNWSLHQLYGLVGLITGNLDPSTKKINIEMIELEIARFRHIHIQDENVNLD